MYIDISQSGMNIIAGTNSLQLCYMILQLFHNICIIMNLLNDIKLLFVIMLIDLLCYLSLVSSLFHWSNAYIIGK